MQLVTDLETSSSPHSLNLDDTSSRLETPFLNSSIPEESAVEIADTSYAPCLSPDEPVIEITGDGYGSVDIAPSDIHIDGDDVTSQTEPELRHRFTSTPMDQDSSEIESQKADELDLVKTQLFPLLEKETYHQTNKVQLASTTSQKKLIFMVGAILVFIFISVLLLLEVSATTPIIVTIRQLAPVKYIRRYYYMPLRKLVRGALW